MRRVLLSTLGGVGGLLAVGSILLAVGGGSGAREARAGVHGSAGSRNASALRNYGRLPLRFETNVGQSDARVRFLARAPGSSVFLTSAGATLALTPPAPTRGARARGSRPAVVGLGLVGADPGARMSGVDLQPGVTNYLVGSDRSRWRTGVPGYGRVSYRSIYPGIDLSFYGRQRQLEYDFRLKPGADVGRIALSLSGPSSSRLDRGGDLVLDTPAGPMRQHAPLIYQSVGARRQSVSGGYVLRAHGRVGFRVGRYDHSRALVIDPVLSYGTYLGGSGSDTVNAVALDPSCSSSCPAYLTGSTSSSDFPVNNAFQGTRGGTGRDTDAFVSKLSADGSALVYSTYLGGSSGDSGAGIAVDSTGRAFVTGSTSSAAGAPPAKAFPTTAGAFQPTQGGRSDAFLAVLKADGSGLDYSTFLGGAFNDSGSGVAVQGGKAYVTGATNSPTFPTTAGAFKRTCGTVAAPCSRSRGPSDAFVAEIDPASGAASLVYSTFLGGGGGDSGAGIAVDSTGAAYVTGSTASTDFPATPGALQPALSGGGDAFVAKLKPDGSGLSYATYLGGGNPAFGAGGVGAGIAVDPACASSCSAYVTGNTSSTDFPTTSGAYARTATGSVNVAAFVSGLTPDGSGLAYSTYLVGPSNGFKSDEGTAIALRSGKAYVTGFTASSDFPVRDPVERAQGSVGDSDAFLSELDPGVSGSAALVYSTRLGGDGGDVGNGLAVDGSDSAYVGGSTGANRGGFPTTPGVLQPGGSGGGFAVKVSPVDPALAYVTGVSPLSGSVSGGATVRITGRGFGPATGVLFGSTPARSFTVDSSGQITAVSPAHAVGAAAVTVTTPRGTSPANPITRFSYGQGSFRGTGSPSTLGIKPVVLKDGRVLLFSPPTAQRSFDTPASAQLYDPKTETWTSTAAPTRLGGYVADIRSLPYTATLLGNGKVLVTDAGSTSTPVADTAQLYDPAGGGSWTNTAGPPSVQRSQDTATRLDGPACRGASPPSYCGRVLLAGGLPSSDNGGVNYKSAELYDPRTDSFSMAGSMKSTRRQHGAALLDGVACHGASPPAYCGKVLVAGGFDLMGNPIASAELYDPATDSWSDAAPLNEFRARNNLVGLPDGRVLDAGGQDVAGRRVEDTELYDPVSDSWTVSKIYPGNYPTIPTLLPNGTVLSIEVAGGDSTVDSGEPAFLFGPALNAAGDWVFAGLKPAAGTSAGAVLLSSDPLSLGADPGTFKGDPAVCGADCGKVLVVGGDIDPPISFPAQVLGSAQLFTPEPPPAAAGAGPGPGPGSGGIPGIPTPGTPGGPPGSTPGPSGRLPRANLPGLRLSGRRRVRGRRTIFVIRGVLRLPASIPASERPLVCRGLVTVAVRRGHKTGGTKTVRLRKDCSFSLTIAVSTRRLGGKGRYNIRVRFHGNANLNARSQTTNIR